MSDLDRRLEVLERAEAQRRPVRNGPILTDKERWDALGELMAAGKLTRTPDREWQGTEARTERIAELLNRAEERRRNDDRED